MGLTEVLEKQVDMSSPGLPLNLAFGKARRLSGLRDVRFGLWTPLKPPPALGEPDQCHSRQVGATKHFVPLVEREQSPKIEDGSGVWRLLRDQSLLR